MAFRYYMDHNATTPVLPEVVAAVTEELRAFPGNPSSAHGEGRRTRQRVAHARCQVAELLGGAPGDVVFTSGGTEANAMGLWGALTARGFTGARLLVSSVEHPAIFSQARALAKIGVRVAELEVDGVGAVRLDQLAGFLDRHPGSVVAVQAANSETGVLQDVGAVAAVVRGYGGHLHCDAVQALAKVPVDVGQWGADTVALAAHKFGGPPGVGALYVGPSVSLHPLVAGAQEGHRRGGSENVPGIVGLGVAAELARERTGSWADTAGLRDFLEATVVAAAPQLRCWGRGVPRLPNTSLLGFPPPAQADVLVAALDLDGFAVSSGPACSSGLGKGSQAVMAMGGTREQARGTVRVSLGPGTDMAAVVALKDALLRLLDGGES